MARFFEQLSAAIFYQQISLANMQNKIATAGRFACEFPIQITAECPYYTRALELDHI